MIRLKTLMQGILKSSVISNGPVCRELEETIRDYYGVRYALSCANCTFGLTFSLRALKTLLDAKLCAIPSFTWYSTRFAAEAAGLNLTYIDINIDNWQMLPVIGDKQTIIIPVSTFGCHVNNTLYQGNVLIDAAHALGTPIDFSREIYGAVLSFSPSKIVTAGEGGMLLTNDSSLAAEFDEYRRRYGRMSEMNAAMCLAHWDGLEAYIRDKKGRWQRYSKLLTPQKTALTNYSTAGFRVAGRDALRGYLSERGVETRVYYDPLKAGLPNTDRLYREIICLPNWYGCPTDSVLKAVEQYLESNK